MRMATIILPNIPYVDAWISLRELEELYHNQIEKDNGDS